METANGAFCGCGVVVRLGWGAKWLLSKMSGEGGKVSAEEENEPLKFVVLLFEARCRMRRSRTPRRTSTSRLCLFSYMSMANGTIRRLLVLAILSAHEILILV